jgi:Na+-transporting NADH:ubiquinone oxidoreductase subunit C
MRKHFFSVIYMFFLTLFFTSLVSAVKLLNEERIAINERVKFQRIVLEVLGTPVKDVVSDLELVRIFEERVKSITVQDRALYVGYKEDGRTVAGYAFPVGGPGFWGPINGMVAVDPDATRILGVAFYRHSETPGLGARISERWFTEQFKGLKLFPLEEERKIFYLKPEGTGAAPNELDAVTGATGTGRALEAFLNKELDHFLETIWPEVKKKR